MRSRPPTLLRVAAALIPRNGRLFIAQRPPHKRFGLQWEFPGGKLERDEDFKQALAREIREELCWDIEVGELFEHVFHQEDDFAVDLYAFWCTVVGGSLRLIEHVSHHWAHSTELKRFELTLPDRKLARSLERLAKLPAP